MWSEELSSIYVRRLANNTHQTLDRSSPPIDAARIAFTGIPFLLYQHHHRSSGALSVRVSRPEFGRGGAVWAGMELGFGHGRRSPDFVDRARLRAKDHSDRRAVG